MDPQELLKQLKSKTSSRSKEQKLELKAFFIGHLLSNAALLDLPRDTILEIAEWFADEIEREHLAASKTPQEPVKTDNPA